MKKAANGFMHFAMKTFAVKTWWILGRREIRAFHGRWKRAKKRVMPGVGDRMKDNLITSGDEIKDELGLPFRSHAILGAGEHENRHVYIAKRIARAKECGHGSHEHKGLNA